MGFVELEAGIRRLLETHSLCFIDDYFGSDH